MKPPNACSGTPVRGRNNVRTSVNFRAYCLNIQPQLLLGGHYVQTYPIAAAKGVGCLQPQITSTTLSAHYGGYSLH